MKRFLQTSAGFGVLLLLTLCIVLYIFSPLISGKTLFPANLLQVSYAPWKYEPVDGFPNGPPNKPIGFDNIREFLPNRKLLKESLRTGVIPLWNPYIYAGAPFMASFDTAVWYPLSWVAAFFPLLRSWDVLVVAQPLLSLLGMFLFLRSLKLTRFIAGYGAIVYAFSGWMVVYWQEILVLEHSFLWLPFALYASNRLHAHEHDRVAFCILIWSLACSVFGGFAQMAIYVYIVTLAWNIYLFFYGSKTWKPFIGIMVSLGIAAIQLIPSAEAFLFSPRGLSDGAETFRNFLLPIRHMITFIAPDFWGNPGSYNYFGGRGFYFEKMLFIGVVPLGFALYAIRVNPSAVTRFWSVLGLVALSAAFDLPSSWLPNILHIPVLSNSYPTRILAVAAFCWSLLAAFGIQEFTSKPKRKILLQICLVFTLLLIAGWFVVFSAWCGQYANHGGMIFCLKPGSQLWGRVYSISTIRQNAALYATVSMRNLIVPTVFVCTFWVIAWLANRKRIVVAVAIIATCVSSAYFIHKYLSFSDPDFAYSSLPVVEKLGNIAGYNRVWGHGDASIERNLPQFFSWYSPDGYGNLSSVRYAQLLSSMNANGSKAGKVGRSDTEILASSQDESMKANGSRLRMLALLGVRYILEHKDKEIAAQVGFSRFPDALFSIVWEDDRWRIWEYHHALPRTWFASSVRVFDTDALMLHALYDETIDLSNTVFLEQNSNRTDSVSSASGSAQIVSYGLNKVIIRTKSDGPGYMVLSDVHYPGWHATVDGAVAPIFRANFAFRAVEVPKGDHMISLTYRPFTVILGGAIAIISILVMFLMLL